MLAAAGYHQYEVSAYAATAGQCRHNLNQAVRRLPRHRCRARGKLTWRRARSSPAQQAAPARCIHARLPTAWCGERSAVRPTSCRSSFMLNALRLRDGVPAALFEQRTGLPLETVAGPLAAQRVGLLADDPARLDRPTQRGFDS